MRHFFLPSQPKLGQFVCLSPKDSNHLIRVLRARLGKEISLAFEGQVYRGRFHSVEEGLAKIYVEEVLDQNSLETKLILCQGVAKGQKMDSIFMHGTEVGVDIFYPVQMQRSVADIGKKYPAKKARYEKIVEEAAKQSNRKVIPKVGELITVKEICEKRGQSDLLIACYEGEEQVDLEDLDLSSYKNIYYVIGPEGGFSPEEIELLQEKGALSVSLGERILRTETAGVVAGYVIKRKLERTLI